MYNFDKYTKYRILGTVLAITVAGFFATQPVYAQVASSTSSGGGLNACDQAIDNYLCKLQEGGNPPTMLIEPPAATIPTIPNSGGQPFLVISTPTDNPQDWKPSAWGTKCVWQYVGPVKTLGTPPMFLYPGDPGAPTLCIVGWDNNFPSNPICSTTASACPLQGPPIPK